MYPDICIPQRYLYAAARKDLGSQGVCGPFFHLAFLVVCVFKEHFFYAKQRKNAVGMVSRPLYDKWGLVLLLP